MLDDLMQTIETLKARIAKHRTYLGSYESRTRVALIDPMLCALGWDVSDPDLVEIEPRLPNGRADYALLGVNRRPVIFVEAKSLSDVKPPDIQTASYAFSYNKSSNSGKVHYCAWTNGDEWEVFDVFTHDSVMNVSITKEDAATCALRLLGLWRRSSQDGGFETAIEPLIYVEDEPVSPLPVGPEPTIVTPPPPQPEAGWIPLDGKINTAKGAAAPSTVRFSNGEVEPVEHWVDILIKIAQYLHRTGKLTQTICPLMIGRTRYLLSADRTHSNDAPFEKPFRIGEGIVLETNWTPDVIIRHSQVLLEKCGEDPSRVGLKFQ